MLDPLTLAAVLFGGCVTALGAQLYRMFRATPTPLSPPQDRAESVRRVLKHVQRVPVAALREGTAAVVLGTARKIAAIELVVSPITRTACLGFHLEIRHANFSSGVHGRWAMRQLHDRSLGSAFELVDDTGAVVRIDGHGLELAITDGQAQFYPAVPPHLQHLVPPAFHAQPVTIEEGLLQPGTRVLAGGVVTREAIAAQYRDGEAFQLALIASPQFPLVASSDLDLLAASDQPIAAAQLFGRR